MARRVRTVFAMGRSVDIYEICDYIIVASCRHGHTLNQLKLQKLMYYAQSWYLAFQGKPLFRGKFQAWPQGPVNREIYDRFGQEKSLQSQVLKTDVCTSFEPARIPFEKRAHLDRLLLTYGKYDDAELQEMISREAPWQEARGVGHETCEREIDEEHMRRYCAVSYLVGWQAAGSPACQMAPVSAPRRAETSIAIGPPVQCA
jgi:uncharacterized phage-associated protein